MNNYILLDTLNIFHHRIQLIWHNYSIFDLIHKMILLNVPFAYYYVLLLNFFLLQLKFHLFLEIENNYHITNKEDYKTTADTMLLGIEDTKTQWVLPDGNLQYALMYSGTANTMVDYPYLTYNDLLKTKQLLRKYFNRSSDVINYLMETKLRYMVSHGITGYNYDI